jgi:hypothetical protein
MCDFPFWPSIHEDGGQKAIPKKAPWPQKAIETQNPWRPLESCGIIEKCRLLEGVGP